MLIGMVWSMCSIPFRAWRVGGWNRRSYVGEAAVVGGVGGTRGWSSCLLMRGVWQKLRRANVKIGMQTAEIAGLKAKLAATSLKRGHSSRYFSSTGGLQIALRSAGSLGANSSISVAVGTDMHCSTVSAWQEIVDRIDFQVSQLGSAAFSPFPS